MDEEKDYKLSSDDVLGVLKRRTQLPETLKREPEKLHNFVKQYEEEGKVDYRRLVDDLWEFHFQSDIPEKATNISGGHAESIATQSQEPVYNSHFNPDEPIVLDSRKLPQSQIDSIQWWQLVMNRLLRKAYPKESQLQTFLSDQMKADARGTVTVDQLKKAIT